MEIIYKDTHEFTKEELEDLFLSVEWSSGHYADKLKIAMENYETVYSAWDNDKLVGLISTMDDGIMTAYIHYLLVNPKYQNMNIGKTLLEMTKNHYKDYLRILLIAYKDKSIFYEKCGFKGEDYALPMCITTLWT